MTCQTWADFYSFSFVFFQVPLHAILPREVLIPSIAVRRSYYFEDPNGGYIEGIARFFSFGSIFECLREIDIYDGEGDSIGLIQGFWDTENSAKYVLYDHNNQPFAKAYCDRKKFLLVDYNDPNIKIAHFQKHLKLRYGSVVYSWIVNVFHDEMIDPRILSIFTAYIAEAYFSSFINRESAEIVFD